LKGLGFLQNKPQPVALPDEEYPAWLWKLLEEDAGVKAGAKVEVTIKGEKVLLDKQAVRRKNRDSIRVRPDIALYAFAD
jgi:large subunit ribosomal protein L54